MVMSAEILGECAFSFLYIPHSLIRHEASTYDPRTVQPEGEPAGSALRRRHPTRSPSARVQPWEKLRALHPHGLQAGGVQPKDVDNRRRDLGGLDRTRDGRRSSSCPPYTSHRRSAS